MQTRAFISRLLIGFVLVSIGFALGRESARREARQPAADAGTAIPTAHQAGQDKVIVYYMHQTFRCVTCNKIESLTGELVKIDFAKPLQDAQLEYRQVNFQENEALAKRYNVVSSCVVLVKVRDGKEVEHKKLDDVWLLIDDRDEFVAYVGGAIREYLGAKG